MRRELLVHNIHTDLLTQWHRYVWCAMLAIALVLAPVFARAQTQSGLFAETPPVMAPVVLATSHEDLAQISDTFDGMRVAMAIGFVVGAGLFIGIVVYLVTKDDEKISGSGDNTETLVITF